MSDKKKSGMVPTVLNALSSLRRSTLDKLLSTNDRDIDYECGHPTQITSTDYAGMYARFGIAKRAVNLLPDECWKVSPVIYETEDETETEFEKAVKELQDHSQIFHYLHRIDRLSGVGKYGLLLLGVNDGKSLDQPMESSDGMELIYLRAFQESVVEVNQYDRDPTSPRYGHPISYSIQFEEEDSGIMNARGVHWSRVIHVADNREMSEVFGIPRMELIYNYLLDAKKISASSSEMFWKGAFPGFALTLDDTTGNVELDTDSVKDEMEKYMNSLQRYMTLTGLKIQPLSPQVSSPKTHLEVQMDLITTSLGVPHRIFYGSERGELASSQDAKAWNGRLSQRQADYLEPMVIRPFFDRLVEMGILPEPAQAYVVDWPPFTERDEKDKAAVAETRTNALSKYVAGGVDTLIPPYHYLTVILGMEDEKATSIIEAAEQQIAEEDALAEESFMEEIEEEDTDREEE